MGRAQALLTDDPTPGRVSIAACHLRLRHEAGRRLAPLLPNPDELANALETAFENLPGDDEAQWIVRTLDVRVRALPADGPTALASMLAHASGAQIRRIIAGEETDGVVRYANRGAWLADLLARHLRGDAVSNWRFAAKADLLVLPFAPAAKQLFAAEPALARSILVALEARGQLAEIVTALGSRASQDILSCMTRANAAQESPDMSRRIAAAATHVPALFNGAPAQHMLFALTRALAADPAMPLPTPAAVRRAQAIIVDRHSAGHSRFPDPAARHPAAFPSDIDPRTKRPGPAPADNGPAPAESIDPRTAPVIDTPFAGIFLLWRSVRELGLDALLPAEDSAARLALASALAGPESARAWQDPALHWLANHIPAAGELLPEPPPDLARRLAALLAERRAPALLHPVRCQQGGIHLVIDSESEDWLALGSRRDIRDFAGAPVAAAGDDHRDPAGDFDFFGVRRARAQRPWALLARAAYADLARRLMGLERSSAHWLWHRVLAGWGQVGPGSWATIRLPRAQLDLVLRMTGIDGSSVSLDDGRRYSLNLPGPS